MKRAIITVGLGFGDEGKGATVDFLTRQLGAELVVRYSGGAQAGHNVQLPCGRRHTFSQFGAGTLAGAQSFIGPRVIICPSTMVPEAEHLRLLGVGDPWSMISVDPDCLISTSYHIWMNRLRETARGASRHGSCGLGIGETRHYWLRYGSDAVFARDLADRQTLIAKLSLMRDRFLIEMQSLPRRDERWSVEMSESIPAVEADGLRNTSTQLSVSGVIPDSETAIFEGSQGVLLDEWFGFHPYTTWSTVTSYHALEMLAAFPGVEPIILGVTRAYASRHGAGPMPTHCRVMSASMRDMGNPVNDWQGAIRFGAFDCVLTDYALRANPVDGVFVTGVDQLDQSPRVAERYQTIERLDLPRGLQQQQQLTRMLESAEPVLSETSADGVLDRIGSMAPVVGIARGPSHIDREWFGDALDRAGVQSIAAAL